MADTPKKDRMDKAFAALLSEEDAQVLTALTRIEQDGDSQAIRPLLETLARSNSQAVQQRITSLLYQVKASNAVEELLAAMNEPSLLDVRRTVLATFWNAGLDVRDHLERFVEVALSGDAQECFECLTIVENQEIWPEKASRLALARVRKAIPSEGDSYKATMLSDLALSLEERLGVE